MLTETTLPNAVDNRTSTAPPETATRRGGGGGKTVSGSDGPRASILLVDDTPENLIALEAVRGRFAAPAPAPAATA